jgi:hypothetical protein
LAPFFFALLSVVANGRQSATRLNRCAASFISVTRGTVSSYSNLMWLVNLFQDLMQPRLYVVARMPVAAAVERARLSEQAAVPRSAVARRPFCRTP